MSAEDFLTRPVVRGVPGQPEVPAEVLDNDLLPWFHHLDGLARIQASTALTGAQVYNASWPTSGLSWTAVAGAGVGFLAVDVYTAAGSWLIELPADKRNDYTQMVMQVDGVQVGAMVDRYNATQVVALYKFGPVNLTRGWHRFRLQTTGRNAANTTAWTLVFSGLWLTRKA